MLLPKIREMDNFDPLLVYMEAFCKIASNEFAGALLRPREDGALIKSV